MVETPIDAVAASTDAVAPAPVAPIDLVAAAGDVAPSTDAVAPAPAAAVLPFPPASPEDDSMSKKSTLELSPGVMDALAVGAP